MSVAIKGMMQGFLDTSVWPKFEVFVFLGLFESMVQVALVTITTGCGAAYQAVAAIWLVCLVLMAAFLAFRVRQISKRYGDDGVTFKREVPRLSEKNEII